MFQRGRIVPDFEDQNIRELFIYSYRLIYQIRKDTILIIAVVHGKRQLTPEADLVQLIAKLLFWICKTTE